jgi:cellulose binding protein with CBM2 domain/fibronectin type III domain protein
MRNSNLVNRIRGSRIAAGAVGLAALAGLAFAAPASADTGAPTAVFEKASDWGNGFVAGYSINNDSASPMEGWTLEFDLPPNEQITSAWSAKLSSSGNHYVLTDEEWTRQVPVGGSVEIGFQGEYSGKFVAPQNCRLDGRPCDGVPVVPDTTPPSAVTGLSAGSVTASSVALRWNPATDDVGVDHYAIYDGSDLVATTTLTSTRVTGLAPASAHTFTVRALDAAGNVSPPGTGVEVTTAPAGGGDEGSGATPAEFAPYVDMTLSNDSLAEMMSASGVRHFSLAFIVSGRPCEASWGGFYGIGDPAMKERIDDLQAAGGDAIVSFGGAINQDLSRTCTSVDALAAQYQAVIDEYGIRDLDFDIEGADQTDAASLERRFQAIAQIQAAGRADGEPVRISLTLPTSPSGLSEDGLDVVKDAIANGVEVGTVNLMAMDYYDPALDYAGRMGDYAIGAATGTHDQLATLYPERSDAQIWAMVGVTPMIGINDDPAEVFTTADAAKLSAFAQEEGLGRLAMWSINRDAPCPAPTQTTANTCSGVPDAAWAFSDAFKTFGS